MYGDSGKTVVDHAHVTAGRYGLEAAHLCLIVGEIIEERGFRTNQSEDQRHQ